MERIGTDISDDEIATKIKELGDGERPPSRSLFNSDPIDITSAEVEERFESWEKAVQIVGYDPNNPPIDRKQSEKTSPTKSTTKEDDTDNPSTETTTDKKSKIGKTQNNSNDSEEKDEDKSKKGNSTEKQRIIDKIEEMETNGIAPTLEEFVEDTPWITTTDIYNNHNSWTSLVSESQANQPTTTKQQYSDEDLIAQIESLSSNGIAPTTIEFDEADDTASLSTVMKRLGSWKEAINQTSLKQRKRENHNSKSDEYLLDQIRKHAENNNPPTADEFKENSELPFSLYIDRFDKWSNAVKKAGYKPNSKGISNKYTREEIKNQIKSLSTDGDPPSAKEFTDAEETASLGPVLRIFDSWANALASVELENTTTTTSDIVDQIQSLKDDGPPTPTEFNTAKNTCSTSKVINKFGSWNNALEEAGYPPQTTDT